MATIYQRTSGLGDCARLGHGTVYSKAYTLAQEVRIEVGVHALRLNIREARQLVKDTQAAIDKLIKKG